MNQSASYLYSLADPDEAQRQCRACGRAATRTHVSIPYGPANALIFLLYDTPMDRSGTLKRGVNTSITEDPMEGLLLKRGIAIENCARGDCCACNIPERRRPSRLELNSCSHWLHLSLTKRFSPRIVLAIGATASCLFYTAKTLSVAIHCAETSNYIPDLEWARDAGLLVVPVPQVQSLSAQRRSYDGRPWVDIANDQVDIAASLLRFRLSPTTS